MHSASDFEPSECVNVPSGHATHLTLPSSFEYVPAGHGRHVLFTDTVPTGQGTVIGGIDI